MPTPTEDPNLRTLANQFGERLIVGRRAEFELGAMIDQVRHERLWSAWPDGGHASFEEWSFKVLGFKARKAKYLASNWRALSALHLSEVALTSALRIGWTKLGHLLKVARDEVSLLRWIDTVNERRLTETQLREEVALAQGAMPQGNDTDGAADRQRFTAKLVFEDSESYSTYMAAVNAVRRRFDPEMGLGRASAMIATSYLAALPRDDEGGAAVELEYLLGRMEQTYRVRLGVLAAPTAAQTISTSEF